MQASLERTTKSLSTTQLHLSILHWEALEGTTTSTLNALDELTIHSKPPAYLTSSLELMTPLLTDPVQDTSGCGCRSGFHLGLLPAILPNVDGSAPSGPRACKASSKSLLQTGHPGRAARIPLQPFGVG